MRGIRRCQRVLDRLNRMVEQAKRSGDTFALECARDWVGELDEALVEAVGKKR